MRNIFIVAVLVVTILFTGCKKHEQCAAGDTSEVCKLFQECVQSNTSTAVCRMGEQDASKPAKDFAPANSGGADALQDKQPSRSSSAPQQPKH